jgi:hypothetical protein
LEQEEASWLAGLLKGIYLGTRYKAINPALFTPLPDLRAYITAPSSRLKMGLHTGFCFPRNSPLSVPACCPITQQQVKSKRKILKSNEALGIWGDGWSPRSYLGFSTMFLLQSLLNYI